MTALQMRLGRRESGARGAVQSARLDPLQHTVQPRLQCSAVYL